MTKPLVLASTSRYRREILGMLQVPFTCVAPEFDERAWDHLFDSQGPGPFAVAMAAGKAKAVMQRPDLYPKGAVIISADQVVHLPYREMGVRKNHQFHKPGTVENAVRDLMRLSGQTFNSTTGVCVLDTSTNQCAVSTSEERLTMRAFDSKEAEAYVQKYQPLDCAGSYRIADGLPLFEKIETHDWFGVQGMPIMLLMRLLREFGVLPTRPSLLGMRSAFVAGLRDVYGLPGWG